jgi:hypothetical protein
MWGTKINERLASDLQAEFSGVEGFSPRNFGYMRALAEARPEQEILQSLIAKLPWGTTCGTAHLLSLAATSIRCAPPKAFGSSG